MSEKPVERKDFKWNFLKLIVLRIDFTPIFDSEIDIIIQKIKSFLKDKDFNRVTESIDNQVDLSLDENVEEGGSIPIRELRRTKIYSIVNEKSGYVFEISRNFVSLRVSTSNYSRFEDYSSLFLKVVELFSSNIDIFTPIRFGLRKINYCFLDHLDDVPTYFNNSYFLFHNPFTNSQIVMNENKQHLFFETNKMNIITSINLGKLKNSCETQNIYKVVLDTDIYVDEEQKINALISSNEQLDKLNNAVFEVYKDALSDKMVEILCSDDDIPTGLTGVNRND